MSPSFSPLFSGSTVSMSVPVRYGGGCRERRHEHADYEQLFLRLHIFYEFGNDFLFRLAVDALRTRTYQRSAAFGAYAELFVIRRFDDFKLFRNVFALAHRFDEQHGGVAQGAHGIGITEHTNGTLFVFRKHRKAGVAVHTLVLSRFDFIKRNGPAEVVGGDLVGVDLFLTYEQHVAAIFGFDRNIAHYGKKVGECRVFTGAKLFHFFIAQSRVDQEFFHCSVLRRVVPA